MQYLFGLSLLVSSVAAVPGYSSLADFVGENAKGSDVVSLSGCTDYIDFSDGRGYVLSYDSYGGWGTIVCQDTCPETELNYGGCWKNVLTYDTYVCIAAKQAGIAAGQRFAYYVHPYGDVNVTGCNDNGVSGKPGYGMYDYNYKIVPQANIGDTTGVIGHDGQPQPEVFVVDSCAYSGNTTSNHGYFGYQYSALAYFQMQCSVSCTQSDVLPDDKGCPDENASASLGYCVAASMLGIPTMSPFVVKWNAQEETILTGCRKNGIRTKSGTSWETWTLVAANPPTPMPTPRPIHGLAEDYKLGDSSGCDAGWERVRDQWECFAAPGRIDPSTTGKQRGTDYLSYGLTSAKGNSKSGYASPGCGYLREGSAKSPSNDKNSEMTYFNMDMSGTYLGNEDEWNFPPLPYCKRAGSTINQNEVLFLGDVDIDNWRTTSESFPGSYNVGWGASCKGLRWRLDSLMEAFEPSMVVLVCGEKDLDDGVSVRKTLRRFKKIVSMVMSHHAGVVYLGTRPEPQKTKEQHAKYRNFDLSIRRLVRRRAQDEDHHHYDEKTFSMIDVHNNFIGAGNPRNLYAFDGMRLSEAGYKLWTSWTQKALDDTTCAVWGDGTCKRRRKMSRLRRATMVIGKETIV